MFTIDSAIDAVQNTKKSIVTHTVKDTTMSSSLNGLVDAQTAYTKAVAQTAQTAAQHITQQLIDAGNEASKAARTAFEQIGNNDFVKDMQQRMNKDFFDSFWREAFRWYTPATAAKPKTAE